MIVETIAQYAPSGDKPGEEGSRESILVLLALARHGPLTDTRLRRLTGLHYDDISQALRGLKHRQRVRRTPDGIGVTWEVVR
jgi:DNA-binding MarR family transcriptional regulator